MFTTRLFALMAIASCGPLAVACGASGADFVRVRAPRIALTHVATIDGTGAPPAYDQTIVIDGHQITAIGPSTTVAIPPNTETLDLRGYTVIPGLVGMHNHLFYATAGGERHINQARSLGHLYLAAGVTSIRTAGTFDLDEDIALRRDIEDGRQVGPRVYLSSPYLHAQPDVDALTRAIDGFADAGVTSLKAYTSLGRAGLAAAISAGHRRGMKVTGHLCAVGFREAAALGIDNLEHGLVVDTEFFSRKRDNQCPDWGATLAELARANVDGPGIQELIRQLVDRKVTVTSTLAVFESLARSQPSYDPRAEPLFTLYALHGYRRELDKRKANPAEFSAWDDLVKLEMMFERRFVGAGGALVAGADPTGWGGALAGLADQRNVELLVDAGFTPVEAIQIATANGAALLGEAGKFGTLQPGKLADLVVIHGDPASTIRAIRNVEIVFKDGVGYDSEALFRAEYGQIGEWMPRIWWAALAGPFAAILLYVARQFVGRRKLRPSSSGLIRPS